MQVVHKEAKAVDKQMLTPIQINSGEILYVQTTQVVPENDRGAASVLVFGC